MSIFAKLKKDLAKLQNDELSENLFGTSEVPETLDAARADAYPMNKIHGMFIGYRSGIVGVHTGTPTVRTFYSRDWVLLVEMVKDSKTITFDWKIYVQEISEEEELPKSKQDREAIFREMF